MLTKLVLTCLFAAALGFLCLAFASTVKKLRTMKREDKIENIVLEKVIKENESN